MAAPPPSPFFNDWPLKERRASGPKKLPAPHQKDALGHLGRWYRDLPAADAGGILVLPTGGGKTFTAVHFLCSGPLSDGYKVLWLAHTHHLLEQAYRGFEDVLCQIREPRSRLALRVVSGTPGHFPPRDIKPTDDVVIATLQTVTNAHREKLDQLRAFVESAQGKLFIVFDEAHHSPAPSYRKLLLDLRGVGAPALGLTATPTYSDESKKGWLKRLFPQGILAQAKVSDLIAQGVLARPTFEHKPTAIVPDFDEADYQKWLGTFRDIPEDVVEQLARSADRNAFIARTYADDQKKYGKTIIFTDRWYQCEAIVEALAKLDVKAGAVYSHVDAQPSSVDGRRRRTRDENAQVLAKFRAGEINVIVNVKMLTEGTDLPDAQTVFLTRQTTSQILLTQMIGRALRGPKFGGTESAYIVSFVDSWQQTIRFAEYDPLTDGKVDDGTRTSPKRPPLQLISIDLVRRLARQMEGGTNITPGPFTSLMPTGWFRVQYDAVPQGSEEVEVQDQLVIVFEDERAGFDHLIAALLKETPAAFESETVVFDDHRETLQVWCSKYLAGVARAPSDVLLDIFQIARHIAQGNGAPEFFPFEARQDHDLDRLAESFIARDLGPRAIHDALQAEFVRKDRFWRALFPRFDNLRNIRCLSGAHSLRRSGRASRNAAAGRVSQRRGARRGDQGAGQAARRRVPLLRLLSHVDRRSHRAGLPRRHPRPRQPSDSLQDLQLPQEQANAPVHDPADDAEGSSGRAGALRRAEAGERRRPRPLGALPAPDHQLQLPVRGDLERGHRRQGRRLLQLDPRPRTREQAELARTTASWPRRPHPGGAPPGRQAAHPEPHHHLPGREGRNVALSHHVDGGSGVEIFFKSAKLAKVLNQEALLRKTYGAVNAKQIRLRMAVLAAASNLADVPVARPERRHELAGDRAGCFAVDAQQPFRIIFTPANDPPPKKPGGGFHLQRVTEITILEIVDYH